MAATLGIDIGGTGIKAALVETRTGQLATRRFRLLTPKPATPAAVARRVASIVRHFKWHQPIGMGFPGVVKDRTVLFAANLDESWLGVDAYALFEEATQLPVTILNDADCAGLAEMRYGAGRGERGVVLFVAFGTGIGNALFVDGRLVPNVELGHIELRGKDSELRASARLRTELDLSWKQWGRRVNEYLLALERLLWPDLVIIGGGVSKSYSKFLPYVRIRARMVPAQLRNNGGIVGAALAGLRPKR